MSGTTPVRTSCRELGSPSPLAWTLSFVAHVCVGAACCLVQVEAPSERPSVAPVESPTVTVALVSPAPPPELRELVIEDPDPPVLELPEIEIPLEPIEIAEAEPDVIEEPAEPEPVEDFVPDPPLRALPPRLPLPPLPVAPPARPKPPPPPPEVKPPVVARRPERPAPPEPAPKPQASRAPEQAKVDSPTPLGQNLPPAYPRLARRRGLEGVVVLRLRISRNGTCLAVQVKESSGHPVLDRSAVAAVRRWRFKPARLNGEPVEAELEVPIRFRLAD